MIVSAPSVILSRNAILSLYSICAALRNGPDAMKLIYGLDDDGGIEYELS